MSFRGSVIGFLTTLLVCRQSVVASELRQSSPINIAGGRVVLAWKPSTPTDRPNNLVIHFHGASEAVGKAFQRCKLNGVVAIVNFPGLSSAYSKPFRDDPALFDRIVRLTQKELAKTAVGGEQSPFQRLYLSSFSAGFGAVRELLKEPKIFERIDAIVAADSLYAGLESESPQRSVNRRHMSDFLRFAEDSVKGRKAFIISHSNQPTPYASTTETADYLLRNLGIDRKPDATIAMPDFRQVTGAEKGRFQVLGFAGESGRDHMAHLHHLDRLWDLLSLDQP